MCKGSKQICLCTNYGEKLEVNISVIKHEDSIEVIQLTGIFKVEAISLLFSSISFFLLQSPLKQQKKTWKVKILGLLSQEDLSNGSALNVIMSLSKCANQANKKMLFILSIHTLQSPQILRIELWGSVLRHLSETCKPHHVSHHLHSAGPQ